MRIIILLSIVISLSISAFAQDNRIIETPPEVDTWGLYTGQYSIDIAKKFEWDWEYEKAIWIYINLMDTEQRSMAIKRVKGLKVKVGDLVSFIDNTYQYYAMLDPEITEKKGDTLYIKDQELLAQKRKWTNELIDAVSLQ